MNIKFILRQYVKTAVNRVFLPMVYKVYSRKPVKKGKVIFADGHHHELPYSITYMYECLKNKTAFYSASFGGFWQRRLYIGAEGDGSLYKSYATAEYVFLCDYYVPAGSCNVGGNAGHSALACLRCVKKFGYDAAEDMSSFYKGNSMKNCTLVTVSSKL